MNLAELKAHQTDFLDKFKSGQYATVITEFVEAKLEQMPDSTESEIEEKYKYVDRLFELMKPTDGITDYKARLAEAEDKSTILIEILDNVADIQHFDIKTLMLSYSQELMKLKSTFANK